MLKRHLLESTVKQNMAPFPEEMEPYTFVFLTKDTVKRFGITLLDALLLQVKSKFVIESLLHFRVVESFIATFESLIVKLG